LVVGIQMKLSSMSPPLPPQVGPPSGGRPMSNFGEVSPPGLVMTPPVGSSVAVPVALSVRPPALSSEVPEPESEVPEPVDGNKVMLPMLADADADAPPVS